MPENKDKKGRFIKGIHYSTKTEFKKGSSGFNRKHTKETKEKMKGRIPWIIGKHHTEKAKNNIKKKQIGQHHSTKTEFKIGKEHLNWQGGKSFEPYTLDWTETLKRSIRERDHYTCQVCGKEPAIHIHHIDYDKKNCNPINLITLCRSCHAKTNFDRNYWIKLFKKKLEL